MSENKFSTKWYFSKDGFFIHEQSVIATLDAMYRASESEDTKAEILNFRNQLIDEYRRIKGGIELHLMGIQNDPTITDIRYVTDKNDEQSS